MDFFPAGDGSTTNVIIFNFNKNQEKNMFLMGQNKNINGKYIFFAFDKISEKYKLELFWGLIF